MPYIILIIALLLEVVGTTLLKYSDGFKNFWVGLSSYPIYFISIYLFSKSLQKINLAVADTIWQGLGIVLITMVSYLVFKEQLNHQQIIFMIITLIGVIGLGLS